jgi:outer membrane protein OmpA-like peptidoglycan-associated protein
MKTIRSLAVFGLMLGTIAGCAAGLPPQDLVTARTAYNRAHDDGTTLQANPRDMDAAKKQLDVAEASFEADGDTQGTRDQSYLALRKTELAVVIARTARSEGATGATVDAMHADEKRTVAGTAAALARSKNENATQDAALAAQNVTIANGKIALTDEKARREDAEKRAAQAAADLAKFASVKQEPRGMVITLNGSVLFASAKSELLPAAQLKLNEVASALIKEDPLSKIIVEGHTDSQGGATYNQDLSQRRAQSVRDYLVSRGIAADRVTSQGFGPSRSIAENNSAEGRANNRRVEIVVQPSATPH